MKHRQLRRPGDGTEVGNRIGAASPFASLAGDFASTPYCRQGALGSARLRRRKYMNVALLAIDEVGFEQLGRAEASLLFRLVSYRYGRGSIDRKSVV